MLVYGGYLTIEGAIGVGTLFAFVLYLQNFFDPVQQLSLVYNTYLAATAALNRIFDVMDTEPELVDAPGAVALERIEGQSSSTTCASATATGPTCCTASTSSPSRARRSRSSATRARASRRS